MTKNLIGKGRTKEAPYATFEGLGDFGTMTVHVLKGYQKASTEAENIYARWFVAVRSSHTHGSYDLGDSYVSSTVQGLTLTYASDAFKEHYWDSITDLQGRAGFHVNLHEAGEFANEM